MTEKLCVEAHGVHGIQIEDVLDASSAALHVVDEVLCVSASEEYFKRQEVKLSDNDTLGSVCDEISRSATANAGVPSPEIIQKLVDLVKGNSNLKFSSSELANFAGVVPLYAPKYPVLKELASILAERVRANSTSNSNPF